MIEQIKKYLLAAHPHIFSELGVKIQDSERTASLNDTLEKIESTKYIAGITRVADITQLDKTGITAFQSIRPNAEIAENTFTVFSGKGNNPEAAKISAIAEGIERFCAELKQHPEEKIITDSYNNLIKNNYTVIHPDQFNIPQSNQFSPEEDIEWVISEDIMSSEKHLIPACTVFFPYEPRTGRSPLRYFTTGLAVGNSYVEAIAHGLAEVIERDAAALNKILRDKPTVDLDTISNTEIKKIIGQFIHAGLNIIVRYISASDINVPVFSVICEDINYQDPLYVSGGYGAHINKDIALMAALNEAALSRVGTISGAREDLARFAEKRKMNYAEFKKKYAYWFDMTKSNIDYRNISTGTHSTVLDDLVQMISEVRRAGFKHILYVDLSVPGLPLPVVKVLVPGIERYSYQMQCIGKRAKRMYEEKYGKPLIKN